MVPISFPRQRRTKAPTITARTSTEPLEHTDPGDDEESDDDDSESIPKATKRELDSHLERM